MAPSWPPDQGKTRTGPEEKTPGRYMSVVDEIRARLDIVDVVSGYVALQKSGRNFKANCPFHNERTPSFIVNPERQSWRCFGACATGGDVFGFVMRAENLEFGDALKLLAQKAGVTLSERRNSDQSDALYRVNQLAARFYQDVLASPQGQHTMKYLESRGISADTRARFELGLSPQGWDGLKSHLLSLGVEEEQAVLAGLLTRGDNGRTWDFFRCRLMIPIHDRDGRVVGFGARALDDSKPKYINTAQTPIFDKRSTLYGLHMAANGIRAKGVAVIVEGYMDVIGPHQRGYTNVVASMGTALTEHQVSMLKSLAKDLVLALDADAAGQEAMQRALLDTWEKLLHQRVASGRRSADLYYREPLNLRVAVLPEGRDPDDLARESPEEWERLIESAVPLMDYLIPAVVSRFDMSTGQGKTQAVEFLFPIIASENAFDQDRYLGKLAEALKVTRAVLDASIARLPVRSGPRNNQRPASSPEGAGATFGRPEASLEGYTLALLLRRPELKEQVAHHHAQLFRDAEIRELFTRWISCTTMDDLWKCVDESLHERLKSLTEREFAPSDRKESEVALAQCLQRLERLHLQELQESLLAAESSSGPPPRNLEQEIATVNARLKELFAQRARPV